MVNLGIINDFVKDNLYNHSTQYGNFENQDRIYSSCCKLKGMTMVHSRKKLNFVTLPEDLPTRWKKTLIRFQKKIF